MLGVGWFTRTLFLANELFSVAVPTLRTWSYAQDGEDPGWWTPFVEQRLALVAVEPLAAQLDHFYGVISGKAASIITVADALQSLLAVEAVRQSIATDQTVALADLR